MGKRKDTEAKPAAFDTAGEPTAAAPTPADQSPAEQIPTQAVSAQPIAAQEPGASVAADPEAERAMQLIETIQAAAAGHAGRLPVVDAAPSISPAADYDNPAPLAELPPLPAPEIAPRQPAAMGSAPIADHSETHAPAKPRSRFAMLAACVAVAAGLGAMAGGLGAAGVASVNAPAPVQPVSPLAGIDLGTLQDSIAKMRADVAAMRSASEGGVKAASSQFAKITDRLDRLERSMGEQAKLAKAVEALERRSAAASETTGSVSSQPRAAAAAPSAPASAAAPAVVDGWIVRTANRNVAVIQGQRMGVIEVERGDVVPGLGRIEAIRRQDGQWIVVTAKGMILQR